MSAAQQNAHGQGVSHATDHSKVPEKIQEAAPAGLERKLPENVHPPYPIPIPLSLLHKTSSLQEIRFIQRATQCTAIAPKSRMPRAAETQVLCRRSCRRCCRRVWRGRFLMLFMIRGMRGDCIGSSIRARARESRERWESRETRVIEYERIVCNNIELCFGFLLLSCALFYFYNFAKRFCKIWIERSFLIFSSWLLNADFLKHLFFSAQSNASTRMMQCLSETCIGVSSRGSERKPSIFFFLSQETNPAIQGNCFEPPIFIRI